MWRLENFEISPLPATGDVHLFDCMARTGPSDRRLIAVAEVRDVTPVRDEHGNVIALPEVEHVLVGCLDALHDARSELPGADSLEWNRVMLYGGRSSTCRPRPSTRWPGDSLLSPGLGTRAGGRQRASVRRFRTGGSGRRHRVQIPGHGVTVRLPEPPPRRCNRSTTTPASSCRCAVAGSTYPYELTPLSCGDGGSFVEHDLDEAGALVPVDRRPGENVAGVVVGWSNPNQSAPEGVSG